MLNGRTRYSDISFFINEFEYLLKQYLQYLLEKQNKTKKSPDKKSHPKTKHEFPEEAN